MQFKNDQRGSPYPTNRESTLGHLAKGPHHSHVVRRCGTAGDKRILEGIEQDKTDIAARLLEEIGPLKERLIRPKVILPRAQVAPRQEDRE